ncbi:MAG: hypothetical protein JRD69_09830 [Deltaproteobacteria bacterium]|nr:hypothetical protein [Deltaproteobacteria bacterium]
MNNAQLSFFYEEILEHEDITHALEDLKLGVQHESRIVREGAIYGLASIVAVSGIIDPDIIDILRTLAVSDISPGVREVALDELWYIEEVE